MVVAVVVQRSDVLGDECVNVPVAEQGTWAVPRGGWSLRQETCAEL